MDKDEIYARVVEIVAESLDIDEIDLSENTTFASLNADSFDMLEMVTAMEDEFGVTLEDEELSDIENVSDAVNAIARFL